MHRLVVPAVSALVLALAAPSLAAQEREPIPLSPHAVITQEFGWVTLTVEHRRPNARGRELFGALVPFDAPWTPSADQAAKLTVSDDIVLAGRALPAGSYSLWIIPRAEPAPWTLIVSRAADVYHLPYPEGEDLFRVELAPTPLPHVETLALTFPTVSGPEAELRLHWGEWALPIPLSLPDEG